METIDTQFSTLRTAGYSGALNDMLLAYYNDQNSASDTCLEDAQYKFLINEGQTGSLPDMIFSQDSVFTLVTVDSILLETGDSILLETGDTLLKE